MKRAFWCITIIIAAVSCGTSKRVVKETAEEAPVTTWAPAGDHIMTSWAAEVSPSTVAGAYPRPRMIRPEWMSLNGLWDYAVTAKDAPCPEEFDGEILVPFCIESALSGVGRKVSPDEALWYSVSFTLPEDWEKGTILNFGAVDHTCEVWLNGESLGTHEGGYTAFSFDITALISPTGPQHLVVKVLDGTDNNEQPRGKQVSNPNGIWYTAVTGIWQTVWVEPVSVPDNIDGYYIDTDIEKGRISVTPLPLIAEDENAEHRMRVTLLEGGVGYDPESPVWGGADPEVILSAECDLGEKVDFDLDDLHLWSPDEPYLYGLKLEYLIDGEVVDAIYGYAAARTITATEDKRLAINGQPLFQFGPLDQGWWPDGLYTAPTDDALRFDIQKTKDFGFNMIRKHVKVEPERWYTWCDRIGIVVWQDMPSITDSRFGHWEQGTWGQASDDSQITETAKDAFFMEWSDIVGQLRDHPSIVVWVPFNEGWAQFETEKVVEFTRQCDPTRLINPASGGSCYPVGDIFDLHNYPDPKMRFRSDGLLVDVLGEFGGIGRPVEGHLWQPDRNWGYVQFKTAEEALEQYGKFAEQLKGLIAEGVAAAVYTQTTDVEGEVNGLMTYDREVIKMDEEGLRQINQDVINSMK